MNNTLEDVPDSKTCTWEQLRKSQGGNQLEAANLHTFHIMTEFKVGRKIQCLSHSLRRLAEGMDKRKGQHFAYNVAPSLKHHHSNRVSRKKIGRAHV